MIKRPIILWMACILLVPFAYTQTSPTAVAGATATVKNIDLSQNTAVIEIQNTSRKDIAAYAVSVEAVYANGYKAKSELMQDYGPVLTARGQALLPGATTIQSSSWSTATTTSLVTVNVKVVAIVYADRTAENIDQEALGRVAEHRNSMALMTRTSANTLESALRDQTNEHPGLKAAAAMNALPASSLPTGIGRKYANGLAEEFENASQNASKQGISEREFLAQRLQKLKQRAADAAQYAQIGGK